jgi:GntR family transcriptional regulator, phosphonate transport system regulatory protein
VRIIIDPDSPDFPFEQIAVGLRTMITAGEITGRMPPMSELAADSDVAVGTVQRAYSTLAAEGLIRAVKGRGTFVMPPGEPQA